MFLELKDLLKVVFFLSLLNCWNSSLNTTLQMDKMHPIKSM